MLLSINKRCKWKCFTPPAMQTELSFVECCYNYSVLYHYWVHLILCVTDVCDTDVCNCCAVLSHKQVCSPGGNSKFTRNPGVCTCLHPHFHSVSIVSFCILAFLFVHVSI